MKTKDKRKRRRRNNKLSFTVTDFELHSKKLLKVLGINDLDCCHIFSVSATFCVE
jgi:hypothetical protein